MTLGWAWLAQGGGLHLLACRLSCKEFCNVAANAIGQVFVRGVAFAIHECHTVTVAVLKYIVF